MSSEDHFWFRPIRGVHRCGWSPPEHVQATVRRLAEDAHPHETGGLLLGWWQSGVPVVAAAVEVPDPNATGSRWTRQPEAARAVLEAVRGTSDPAIGYVGDWHSHPANIGPSGRDIRQLKQDSADYPNALALVVVRRGGLLATRLALRGRLTTVTKLQEDA